MKTSSRLGYYPACRYMGGLWVGVARVGRGVSESDKERQLGLAGCPERRCETLHRERELCT